MLAAADPYNVIADIFFNTKGHLIVTHILFFSIFICSQFHFPLPVQPFHYLFSSKGDCCCGIQTGGDSLQHFNHCFV